MMFIQFFVCGARGTYPAAGSDFRVYGKETSCYVIKDRDYAIVLDCGSGLINAKEILKDVKKVDVLLSHVHYDHIMGLYENEHFAPDAEVDFYGEFMEWINLENKHNALYDLQDHIKNDIHSIPLDREFYLYNDYSVSFTRSVHPDSSSMITITKKNLKICYTGDYEFKDKEQLVKWAKNADLLIADGTYTEEESKLYKGRGHSSWKDSLELGKAAKAKKIVIVHHSPFHNDDLLKAEEEKAKEMNPDICFGKQGDTWNL